MNRLFIACAILATASSCSDNIEQGIPANDVVEGRTFTTTVNMPSKADTKVTSDYGSEDAAKWNFSWEASDDCYLVHSGASNEIHGEKMTKESASEDGSSATFSGETYNSFNYAMLYSKGGVKDVTTSRDYNRFPIDFTEQDGDLSDLMMIGDSFVGGTDLPETQLKHVGGFLTINVSFANVPAYFENVTVENIVVSGLSSTGEIDYSKDVNGNFYTEKTVNDISVTPKTTIEVKAGTTTALRLNILPTTLTASNSIKTTLYLSNSTCLEMTFTPTEDVEFSRAQFSTINRVFDLNSSSSDPNVNTKLCYVFEDDDESSPTSIPFDGEVKQDYYISTPKQLSALSALANSGMLVTYPGHTFKLKNDIEVNSTDYNWSPIGYSVSTPFNGVFNGFGHSIIGAKVDGGEDTYDSVGLFGYADGSDTIIKNVEAKSCEVTITATTGTHAAVLVGTLKNGASLLNCGCDFASSVTQTGNGSIGALVGYAAGVEDGDFCDIGNCYVQSNVTSQGTGSVSIGGLCGTANAVNIVNCCYGNTQGEITYNSAATTLNVGALVGSNAQGRTLTDSFYITGCAGDGVKAIAYQKTSLDEGTGLSNLSGVDALIANNLMETTSYTSNFDYANWEDSNYGPILTFDGYGF